MGRVRTRRYAADLHRFAGVHHLTLGGLGDHGVSWVIRISAMSWSRCRFSSSSMICAWMVTSRAVVGSSAISSGLGGDSHGDRHALAHAAGELVG